MTDSDEHIVRRISPTGVITTVAGNGIVGSGGDNGLATQAQLYTPKGIAVGTDGVYIADYQNNRIRKVSNTGIITTVAGTGGYGFTGDGGPATAAQLAGPTDVAITPAGELLITDVYQRVRRISANGTISTLAGNGTIGFSGDGGPAINASFRSLVGIAIDATGNVYVADSGNNRVRRIGIDGIITTVAGNGGSGFGGDGELATQATVQGPQFLAFDASGALYITQSDSRIRRVGIDGLVSTVAGTGMADFSGDGGLATQASLNYPSGIFVNANGEKYVADRENYRIRKISVNGVISTVAGGYLGNGGLATNAYLRRGLFVTPLGTPTNVAVDNRGNVYVSSRYSHEIRKVNPTGVISTVAGTGVLGYSGDGGPATSAKLAYPRGVAPDKTGNLFIVDQYNSRIRKINPEQLITTVAGNGQVNFIDNTPNLSSAEFYNSSTLPIDSVGNLYVFSSCCVAKINPAGVISVVAGTTAGTGFSGDGGPATNARLSYPTSAVVGENNTLYIADGNNNRIRKVNADGIITTIAGTGSAGFGGENVAAVSTPVVPTAITRDAAGNLYISESTFPRIRKIDRNGIITTVAGSGVRGNTGDGGTATNAQLGRPEEIIFDAAGNLYIADAANRNVRKVTYPVQANLIATSSCSATSTTLTATPSGYGFTYQFGAGAVQIGNTNQAIVSTAGVYSVTVSTSVFGSPAGMATLFVGGSEIYTLRNGSWNDPTVWSCGAVPVVGQRVQVGHLIDIPVSYQAAARSVRYTAGGSVRFGQQGRLMLAE
ncbi:MAG: hypothetical protein WBQ60_00440 [Asticcacaulis sp.]